MTDAKNPDGPEILDAEIVEVKGIPFAKGHDPRRGGFKPGFDPNRRTDNVGNPGNLTKTGNPFGSGGRETFEARKQFRIDVRALIRDKALPAIAAAFDSNDVSPQEKAAIGLKLIEYGFGKAKPEPDDGEGGASAAPGEGRTMTVVFVDTAKKEGG